MATPLTEHEKETICRLFPNEYTYKIAEQLGVSYHRVDGYARRIGVKKSLEFKTMELKRQGERLKIDGQKTWFPKGLIPANKGKKISPEHYENLQRTMFKPGNLPWNTKYDGAERTNKDGYTEIRVSIGVYEPKQRKIWKDHHGEIPKGHIITFKDGNKANFSIDNLECVSMKEHANRNNINRFPKELRNTILLLAKLKRKINEKQN